MSREIDAPEHLEFHGLPAIRWRHRGGASAIATLQGAHLVSWTPAGGEERLFLSERSPFARGKAIRGGIPVCFPQFAERGPLPKHGFARTSAWTFTGVREAEEGARATFAFESSPQSLALWPHAFRLQLEATIGGARLDVALQVANTGSESFVFAAALHTYLRIADNAAVRLAGLRGTRYLDLGATEAHVENREVVTAGHLIDRIYFAAPAATRLEDGPRALDIQQRGFTDTVVWNPGKDFTATMADMPPDGYRHMLCVEAASIEPRITLAPGAEWVGGQSIRD
jgi:glucose-6-phosphate 1-epimerase